MTGKTVLPAELRPFEYYTNKLPLYLQNSYGFVEHFRIWYELLVGGEIRCSDLTVASDSLFVSEGSSVVYVIDTLFEILNIFDLNCQITHTSNTDATNHYLTYLSSIGDDDDGTKADILDKIGALFGLKRSFSISINGADIQVNLNNKDFLMLIKCTIIRNWFDGSYKELYNFYYLTGLNVFILTDHEHPATCKMIMLNVADSTLDISLDLQNLFLAGLLTVESAGIEYDYAIYNNTTTAIFDSLLEDNSFDHGLFVA